VFEEKKPAGSDDESELSDNEIIVNPFAAGEPESKPGITMLEEEEADDMSEDDSSDSQNSNEEENDN
jgi:hypothetical protein